MRRLIPLFFVVVLPGIMLGQGKNESTIKPDVKQLEKRFKVTKQRFDADKRRYVCVLEAKVSSEDPCHYDAVFQDADEKEVTSVQIDFEDGGKRTTKGEKYRAYVKYPTRKAMEKVAEIVVKKSD